MINTWAQDVRHALRVLAKSPAFTAAAALSLAISIGANTAIFSVANAVLLRPLPYPDPGRLAILWQRSPGLDVPQDWLSTGQYLDVALENSVFERTAAAIGASFNLTGNGRPERVDGVRVSSSFFPLFGARVARGRVFSADDDVPGKPRIAILSHGFWVRRFGSDPSIVGKTITLNDAPVTVVGVMSATFAFGKEVMPAVNGIQRADLILPLPLPPAARTNRGGEDYNVFARLKSGVSLERAQADMNTIAARMKRDYTETYPATGGLTISVVPLVDQVVGDMRLTLYVLLGAVGLVLLIACGNVANLLMSRATVRERELAIRSAMGADQPRLIRQLVTEAAALSILGGLAGLGIAILGVGALRWFEPANLPRTGDVRVDARVLAFTLALSLLTPLVFGLGPALRASRADPSSILRGGGRGSRAGTHGGSTRGRGRQLLIAAEVALSVVVLLGAGLLVQSYRRITHASPGFDAANVLSFRLTLPAARYKGPEAVSLFYDQLDRRLRALPGVVGVGTNYQLPLSTVALAWEPISIDGYVPKAPGDDRIITSSAYISPDYLRVMGIPLLRGRTFTIHDTRGAPEVVIVDDKLAARYWPNENALGKRLRQGTEGPWRTVVGVVANTREYEAAGQPPITAYFPVEQYGIGSRFVVVRTTPGIDDGPLLAAALREIRAIDPDLPVYDASTMERRLADSLARRRLSMLALTTFGAFALLLAAIGVYSVIAYWVSQRRREFGIRMALGADEASITRLVGRELVVIVGIGLAAGVSVALALTKTMAGLLFGVAATDPATYGVVAVIVLTAALSAMYIPARRAARTQPSITLREE